MTTTRHHALVAAWVCLGLGWSISGSVGGMPVEAAVAPVSDQRAAAAVRAALDDSDPLTNPLVTLANGLQMKASNVYGVEVEGYRYYYRPRYHMSADPLSQGDGRAHRVVEVLDAGTTFETTIYHFLQQGPGLGGRR